MSKRYDPKYQKKKPQQKQTKATNAIADTPKPKKKRKPYRKPHTIDTVPIESLDLSLNVFSFKNLKKAYKKARKGKRYQDECINFHLELLSNLLTLEETIQNKTYQMAPYYSFYVNDPKKRKINALHFADRVVQHVLCDEILSPVLEPRLIYDNAACRQKKGTHFALERLAEFFTDYEKHGEEEGYILRYDFKKFFDSIDHEILKKKLRTVFSDDGLLWLLDQVIDSYESSPGKGLPLGNQSSQWFAIFFLDEFDRLLKEQEHVQYYSRYMDDGVMILESREKAENTLGVIQIAAEKLNLELNRKTEIFPVKNGVDYLGFHFSLSKTGKVVMRVRRGTRRRFYKRLKTMPKQIRAGEITLEYANIVKTSYRAHFRHGTAKGLIRKTRPYTNGNIKALSYTA